MDRTIFIGDLHGCHAEAVELLKQCDVQPNDWVIFLGDYVDRGPDNDRCCDLVREREQQQGRVAGILGNHEKTHLRYCDMETRGTLNAHKMPPTHQATRAQLRPEHYAWFRSLPLFVRVPEHNAAAVHAGCFPGRSLERQKTLHLLHCQMLRPFSFGELGQGLVTDERTLWPSRVPQGEEGWRFWTHFWDGDEALVFGHSVIDRPLVTDRCIGIDGGAVFGYELWAYVLPDKRIVSVKSMTNRDKGERGCSGQRIMRYNIHGDVHTYS